MKRQLTLLVLVILIALVTATPALARPVKQTFTIGGHIAVIDGSSITVETMTGKLVTVQVTASTSFLRWTVDGRKPITFGEVAVGDAVNIKGFVDGESYIASQVTVDVPLSCIR